MKKSYISLFLIIIMIGCQQQNQSNDKNLNSIDVSKSKTSQNEISENRNLKLDETIYSKSELDAMSLQELMALIHEVPNDTIATIGILLYDGYFMLDAMGPLSVLNGMAYTKKLLIGRNKGIVNSSSNVKIQVDYSIKDIDQLDILVIPGGLIETYKATKDKELLDWIKKIDQNSKYTVSVCTGAWILGAAGLLEGKEATTNWYKAEETLSLYGATYVKKRYTNDGKYWTSAGVSAGIDMSLALVDHILGRSYAEAIALNLEYDPNPPFSGGHPDNTNPVISYIIKRMYETGLQSLIETDKE
ncbi:DJ-1/PfpI family protein [uncultured Aquimarina sp.]|uniref:DJ-1/PfpI family protein n=1 Tax=uncultured Aquimarina sp. TaxID=575652 RepID=UPI00262B5D4C|nr:DJ-1/PfpI family protein [uncultured Aquimarina sp.]